MRKLNLSLHASGYIPLILAFFLLFFVKILISFNFKSPWIFADETVYAEIARNIIHGDFFSKLQYCQTYPPGYSLFLSIIYLFFGNSSANYQYFLIINSVITSSIIFPAYFLLKKKCSEHFSIIGSIFVSILPSANLYNFVLMSENVFIPLFTFSLWFVIESFETNSKKWGILTGLSIFLLFFTRSTGIAMIVGFFLAFAYYAIMQLKWKAPTIIVKENIYQVTAFCIPTILWVYYKSKLSTSSVTGYNIEAYSSAIFQAVSNIQSFSRFFILIIHEFEFLVLASYFILFVLALYSLNRFLKHFTIKFGDLTNLEKNQKTMAFECGIIYFLISSILLIIITVTHMVLTKPPDDLYYNIFGRYIDPIVPIIAILGLIGFYIVLNEKTEMKKITILFILSILPLIFLFTIDFPSTYYKFPNMFTIFYVQEVSTFLPVIQFINLFAILLLTFFILIVNYKKFWPLFVIFLMIISIIVIHSTLQIQFKTSSNTEKSNQIGQYLSTNSHESSRILMTNEDFSYPLGTQIWFGTQFYIKGYLIRGVPCIIAPTINCQQNRDLDYIISPRLLPYKVVALSKSGFKLYDVKKPENQSFSKSFIMDIGLNDEEKIENFHHAENNQIRWTKNYSKILVEYPKKCGDPNLSVKISGFRPSDNPANVIFLINDYPLGNITYTGNKTVISYTLQSIYLNDQYNILKIVTNTWNPSEYGLKDNRELGVQVDWISVQNKNPENSEKYCNIQSTMI